MEMQTKQYTNNVTCAGLWADKKKKPAGKECLGVENYAERVGIRLFRDKIRDGIMPTSEKNP